MVFFLVCRDFLSWVNFCFWCLVLVVVVLFMFDEVGFWWLLLMWNCVRWFVLVVVFFLVFWVLLYFLCRCLVVFSCLLLDLRVVLCLFRIVEMDFMWIWERCFCFVMNCFIEVVMVLLVKMVLMLFC